MLRNKRVRDAILDEIVRLHAGDEICVREIMKEFAGQVKFSRYMPFHPGGLHAWFKKDKRFTVVGEKYYSLSPERRYMALYYRVEDGKCNAH